MDKFGIIGWPVAHSLSPKLFSAAYGGRFSYELLGKPTFEESWKAFLDGGYRAINVTAPYKERAFVLADVKSDEAARTGAANIIVNTAEGLKAYNSDYLGVRRILDSLTGIHSACVVGFGGAGKAAMAAAEDFALPVSSVNLFRHNEISDGVKADIIIYTLPKAVPGIDKLNCSVLIEANYKDPCLSYDLTSTEFNQTRDFGHVRVQTNHFLYVPGTEWLRLQAKLGYPLLVGHPRNG